MLGSSLRPLANLAEDGSSWTIRITEDKRKLKRRRLDSDVSDVECVDEHRVDESRKEEMFRLAKKSAHAIHSDMPEEELRQLLRPSECDEVWLLVGLAKVVKHRGPLRRIFEFFGGRWPNDRKSRFMETLIADGFFRQKRPVGMISTFNFLNLRAPYPRLLLMFKGEEGPAATYYASLDGGKRREIMDYLCRYLNSSSEERLVQLESAPFYQKDLQGTYTWRDEDVIRLVETFCRTAEDSPAPAYFRKTREKFIETLIDHGTNARVTAKNAALQAKAFAGEDWYDKCDMIVSLSKWPVVAEGLRKELGSWVGPAPLYRQDRNLKISPECRSVLHQNQLVRSVVVLKDERGLEEAKKVLGDFSHVYVVQNKNPRKLTDVPTAIAFKSPGSPVYVSFPQELPKETTENILRFLAQATVVTKSVKTTRAVFRSCGLVPHFRDLTSGMVKETGGRTNEAIATYVWGHRFCPISKEDWISSDLDAGQSYHLAYYMDMVDQAIQKLGVANIPMA